VANSLPIVNILQLVWNSILGNQTGEQWREFQDAVEEQIQAGLSVSEARVRAAMHMFDTSPDFSDARAALERNISELPDELRSEYESVIGRSGENKEQFDRRMERIASGFTQRERDVMDQISDIGEQDIADIERSFGEQQGAALSDLSSRGLAGSGVGASIRGGFTTRRKDATSRSRDATARLKSNALAGLRGDALNFGGNFAGQSLEAGNQVQNVRERALLNAFNAESGGNAALADALYGQGTNAIDTFLGGTGDYLDFLEGVTNVPPDTSWIGPATASTFQGFAPR
jgi:hypothetical protein